MQSTKHHPIHISPRRHRFDNLIILRSVQLLLEHGPAQVVVEQLLLLLETHERLQRRGDVLGLHEDPGVHAFHTRLQGLPLGPFQGLEDQRVLRHEELRVAVLPEDPAELLKLFDGEAVVVDPGDEVAVLEVELRLACDQEGSSEAGHIAER